MPILGGPSVPGDPRIRLRPTRAVSRPNPSTPARAPAAGEPRITFTIGPLIGADALFLHIEGAGKKAVLDAAREPGDPRERPIRAILLHSPRPLDVLWCP